MVAFSKIRQNWEFRQGFKAFKILPELSKFRHFLHLGENFASLATLVEVATGRNFVS